MSTTADDDRDLVAVMRLLVRAQREGFAFWGERETAEYRDAIFLGYLTGGGVCNAARIRRALRIPPGEQLFAERVSGDALTVLRTVCQDWPRNPTYEDSDDGECGTE